MRRGCEAYLPGRVQEASVFIIVHKGVRRLCWCPEVTKGGGSLYQYVVS